MQKIINRSLLSGVCFLNMVCAVDQIWGSLDLNSTNTAQNGTVSRQGDPLMPEVMSMCQEIRQGTLPQNIIDLFHDVTKIDIAQQRNHEAMRETCMALSNEFLDRIVSVESIRRLNVCLRTLATPLKPNATYIPLAQEFFGKMNKEVLAADFYQMICKAYNTLFTREGTLVSAHVRTPVDWATVRFLNLFLNNAVERLGFVIDAAELKDPALVEQIVMGLNGASSMSLVGVEKLKLEELEAILIKLAETRPKNIQVILKPVTVDEFERSTASLLNSGPLQQRVVRWMLAWLLTLRNRLFMAHFKFRDWLGF